MADQLVNVEAIGSSFQSLSDPRHTRNRKHLLVDIVVIAICALVSGSDGPTAIHRWATNRLDWLQGVLALSNGIPSRDCIRRLLMALKPEAFQKCFQAWIASALLATTNGTKRLVAIDGKTCRGSPDRAEGLGPLHLVSAWAGEAVIALGQIATEETSNEITAIPLLLERLELADTVVTIDAMGCQKEIAQAIVDGGGDCVIAVQDNQPKWREAIERFFHQHLEQDFEDLRYRHHETRESGHGRMDDRSYYLAATPKDLAWREEWSWGKAIGYSGRVSVDGKGKETSEIRYSILSRYLSGKRFGEAVRGHGGIESMHWVLE